MKLPHWPITELAPEEVQFWLRAFQHRQELVKAERPPASSRYLNNLLSTVRQALEYGRLRRYWRNHPLLDYEGKLIEATKEERNRQLNNSLFKPFTVVDRDRILQWLWDHYRECPEKAYNGKEKVRRLMMFHYCRIGFNTGLRSPSEMTALYWPSIDYHRRQIDVCRSREASGSIENQIIRPYTKTIRHRRVPMNDVVLESFRALEEYRQEGRPEVFWNPRAGTKNPLAAANGWAPMTGEKRIRYALDQCLEKLKINSERHQGQYRMRHTFVTLMLDHTSFSDAKVAELIGDTVETMKTHYKGFCINRWHNEDDAQQMNAMNPVGKGRLHVVKS